MVMKKMQFNYFPIISLCDLSVAMATKAKEADWQTFSYFELPLPKQHLYQISHTASVVWKSYHLKMFLFKF